jgi:hypothetical protein
MDSKQRAVQPAEKFNRNVNTTSPMNLYASIAKGILAATTAPNVD